MLTPSHFPKKRPSFAFHILYGNITAVSLSTIKGLDGCVQATRFLFISALLNLPESVYGNLHIVVKLYYFMTIELSGKAEIGNELDVVRYELRAVLPPPLQNSV